MRCDSRHAAYLCQFKRRANQPVIYEMRVLNIGVEQTHIKTDTKSDQSSKVGTTTLAHCGTLTLSFGRGHRKITHIAWLSKHHATVSMMIKLPKTLEF